jgi:hypothetical protein
MKTVFGCLQLHAVFYLNGVKWVKQSTRTAHRYGFPKSWFYFSLDEAVIKERY